MELGGEIGRSWDNEGKDTNEKGNNKEIEKKVWMKQRKRRQGRQNGKEKEGKKIESEQNKN